MLNIKNEDLPIASKLESDEFCFIESFGVLATCFFGFRIADYPRKKKDRKIRNMKCCGHNTGNFHENHPPTVH
jgi:hypothetical protein